MSCKSHELYLFNVVEGEIERKIYIKCTLLYIIVVAQEKLDALFSSPTVWQSQYKDLADVDDMKVPECGERFITLMLTITGNIKHHQYNVSLLC